MQGHIFPTKEVSFLPPSSTIFRSLITWRLTVVRGFILQDSEQQKKKNKQMVTKKRIQNNFKFGSMDIQRREASSSSLSPTFNKSVALAWIAVLKISSLGDN